MAAQKDKKEKSKKTEGKREILNYASLLDPKKRSEKKREVTFEPIKPSEGTRRVRNRIGRGRSAGQGKTCGRGQKGQKSRTGYSRRAGFEGGQMPLHRRLPKRGFTSIFKKEWQLVNLMHLGSFAGEVTPEVLEQAGLINDSTKRVKILGNGEIKSGVKVSADAFSAGAKQKIEAAGGSCVVREPVKKPKKEAAGA